MKSEDSNQFWDSCVTLVYMMPLIFFILLIKGAVPQKNSILKSSYIGHNNSLNIVGFQIFLKKIGSAGNFNYFLVPGTKSPLHVRSKVWMAPFHVRSNADFALHMEGSHADFAPHMEWRHNFRDQKIAKIAIPANLKKIFCSNQRYLRSLYDLCDHIWE